APDSGTIYASPMFRIEPGVQSTADRRTTSHASVVLTRKRNRLIRDRHIIRPMRLRCGRLPIFWLAALAVASSCSAPPAAIEPASKAATVHLTGVWVAVGTFGDPAGPPPWSNTPWPANPPF